METDNHSTTVNRLSFDIYHGNFTCDYAYIPTALELLESFELFWTIIVSFCIINFVSTVVISGLTIYKIIYQDETEAYKKNAVIATSVYPALSLCSVAALIIPRSQLLADTIVQIWLTVSAYRLYLLLIDVGHRKITKPPPLELRVGPCCCWPCLPFPSLQMTGTNLSWLGILVLQFPIVQTALFCIFMFMYVEDPMIYSKYEAFLQPLVITSLLLGMYGMTITTRSLMIDNPDSKIHHKTMIWKLAFLFSKLQAFIIRLLAKTSLFPCTPPVTPIIYSNVTYNALMVIEMLLLSYAAKCIYTVNEDNDDIAESRTDDDKMQLPNISVTGCESKRTNNNV